MEVLASAVDERGEAWGPSRPACNFNAQIMSNDIYL